MTDLNKLTITAALDGLKAKDFTATELTEAHLSAMEAGKALNAYITETPDLARAQAKASDERLAKGQAGLLEGIPLAMKDLFCTKDVRTTAASKILENFVPPYESTVSQKLWDAGAVMLGKVSLDQFGMGSSNINSHFGNVINPWTRKDDPAAQLTAGGSSGGSAAAVAGYQAMGATATDTGGSVRQPAAFTGTVGVKPSYGRCSRWGVIAFASSLDTPSFMGRTVEDATLLLQAASGHDPQDSTSALRDVPDFLAALKNTDLKGLKVGIPKEYNVDGMPADITKIWEQGAQWLKEAGAEIIDVSLPHTHYALATYYILAPAEASSNLARYDGVRYGYRTGEYNDLIDMYEKSRAEGFGDEVKRRILIGTYVLSAGYYDAYYIKAQKVRRLIANDFEAAFEKCDVLLAPTAPSTAFALGENQDDPVKMYLNDVFTIPASLAGAPAMSVPAGLDGQGLPLGLQLISKRWDEETMLKVARALELAANFKGL